MGFRTAFHRSRLSPIGAWPHTGGGYRPQQRVKPRAPHSPLRYDQSGGKAVDGLQGPCEAALARAPPLAQSCPYHHRADQSIGPHLPPQFLRHQLRGSAPPHVPPESRLARAPLERTVPAVALELRHGVSAGEHRVEPGRHHDEHRGAQPASPHTPAPLPHRPLLGQPRRGGLRHPRGLARLAPLHSMRLTAPARATATVRCPAMRLAPHIVAALPTPPRESPVRTVRTSSPHAIATRSGALLWSQQGHCPGRLALGAPHPERRQNPTDQGKDRAHARQRQAYPGLLALGRGRGGLLGRGLGHRDGRARDAFDATPLPEPGLGRLSTQALTPVAGQCRHDAFAEALAGCTITAGRGCARRVACGAHPRAQATERLSAGASGRKDVQEQRPQGAMRGQGGSPK
jgi:hypothetical protein